MVSRRAVAKETTDDEIHVRARSTRGCKRKGKPEAGRRRKVNSSRRRRSNRRTDMKSSARWGRCELSALSNAREEGESTLDVRKGS
jgi:hypothetical protein